MNAKKMRLLFIALIFALGLFVQPAEASEAESFVCGEYHIVRRGETLAEIGRMYGVSWRWLAEVNNLSNPNRIYAGQRLCVSGQVDPDPTPACNDTYVVRRGETLSQIARRYGVSWRWLAEANNLRNPNRIYAGQVLCVPGQVDPHPDPTLACTQYHTVRRGETLAKIGSMYGVSWRWLWDVNNLSNPNRIYAGQVLCVEVDD